MNKKHLFILITISIIASCQNARRQSTSETQIDHFDIMGSIKIALNVSLTNFKGADYSIYPYFHTGIADSTFYKSFLNTNTEIIIDDQQILSLISQYRENEGSDLRSYIFEENKIARLSKSYNDLMLTISPPMVDETHQMIYFYVQALFRNKKNNSIECSDTFYAIKVNRTKHENGEMIIKKFHASFKMID